MTLRDHALIHYARKSTMSPEKIARVVEAADKAGEWDIQQRTPVDVELLKTSVGVEAHLRGVMARHGDA